MMKKEKRDKLIAGAVTLVSAILLLLLFYFGQISGGRSAFASASVAETGNDEEIFIDPDLDLEELRQTPELENTGAEEPEPEQATPADAYKGNPDPSGNEVRQRIEPGKNPKPAPAATPQKTQRRESAVKSEEPSATERERQRAQSRVSNAFGGRNGATDGKNDGRGASEGKGSGMSVSGNVSGRKFLGCDKFTPTLRHKTVVRVSVTVNAAGRVTQASAQGGADAALRRQCERAARTARWSASPGAADQRGTLVFTIIPK